MIPKKIIFLCGCTVILLFPFLTEATQRGIKKVRPISPLGSTISGDQWLVVVGINIYSEWPRLKTAVNDAKSFRDVLLSRYYFDREHLIELYDEKATRKNIISSLRFLAKKTKKSNSLIIYYAGHGHVDPITKAGSWITGKSNINVAADLINRLSPQEVYDKLLKSLPHDETKDYLQRVSKRMKAYQAI